MTHPVFGFSPEELSRRDALRRLGVGAGVLGMTPWLAACGIGGEAERNEGNDEGPSFTTTVVVGTLIFANWPAYIDKAKGESPTLQQFTKATDIEVN